MSSSDEEDDHDTTECYLLPKKKTEQHKHKSLEVASFQDIGVEDFLVIKLKASSNRKSQFLAQVMSIERGIQVSFLRKLPGGTSTEDAKFIFPAVSDTSDIRKDLVIGRVSVDMDRWDSSQNNKNNV